MRQNNCPIPAGALEKDDLINRVEEMASFIVSSPPPKEKLPKVRDDDEDDCKICFERVADYCLVPCGHTGFCFMCARKMEECPFCKKEVGHAQKLWKV
jgi:Zinc finger, C3HC4 type (RING finger)